MATNWEMFVVLQQFTKKCFIVIMYQKISPSCWYLEKGERFAARAQ